MTAYAFAPAGLECFICKDDAPTDGSTMVEVSMLAHELGIAVAVCPVCTTRALAVNADLKLTRFPGGCRLKTDTPLSH